MGGRWGGRDGGWDGEREGGGAGGDGCARRSVGTGQGWTVEQVRKLFKLSGKAIGIDPQELGAHSGRIGGATDLFAEKADAVMLQIQGRG